MPEARVDVVHFPFGPRGSAGQPPIRQHGGSASGAWPTGARGAHLQPLAPPHPQRYATDGSASPGFAPPHAPPAPRVVLPMEASRSRRGAHGRSRSGPCGTACTGMYGCRTNQLRRLLAGGTLLCNGRTPRFDGPDSRRREEYAPRRSGHEADDNRDDRESRSGRRWCPPAKSSESTPGTSRSAVPPLEHPQCKRKN